MESDLSDSTVTEARELCVEDDKAISNTTDESLIARWREFQNMVAASPMWLPDEMRKAQAESWARANVATGDPRFD